MSGSAMVLGSQPGSGNIGSVIARTLQVRGWVVSEDDCYVGEDANAYVYQAPEENLGGYDACVITLGYTCLTPMREVSQMDVQAVLYGSLELPLECMRRYVQDRQTGGKIVVIGSYAHDHALTGCAAYCAAKAGLTAAVKELGWELTPDFYTTIVHPYHVPSTPMGQAVVDGLMEARNMSRQEAEEYQRKDLRIGRHQRPQDIAKVVAWILGQSGSSEWLSGQGISMYGGVR